MFASRSEQQALLLTVLGCTCNIVSNHVMPFFVLIHAVTAHAVHPMTDVDHGPIPQFLALL